MARLRVSVIGVGMAVDAHARSLVDLHETVEVVWAAARTDARLGDFAKRYPFPTTTDVNRALTGSEVDAVILLTPAHTHLELAEQALAAGKHLLVEKPLDVTVARAEKLVRAAERHGRTLAVCLQHRFRPSSVRAREIMASGQLGEVQAATVYVPWWRTQAYYDEPGRGTYARDGGGVLMTQAIHTIDLFRSLVGVRSVDASKVRTTAVHRMEAEDYATALLTLDSGAPGTLVATTAHFPQKPEMIDIIGSRGSLTLTGGALEFTPHGGDTEALADPVKAKLEPPYAAHRALIADFAAAVAEGREPGASGEEALRTARLLDDIVTVSKRA